MDYILAGSCHAVGPEPTQRSVADIADATSVVGGDGTYRAEVSGDWSIWGPNGGYTASIALRAAGAEHRGSRPLSTNAHFVARVDVGPVDLTVATLRRSARAALCHVTTEQSGRVVLDSTVWMLLEGADAIHEPSHRERDDVPDQPLSQPTTWQRLQLDGPLPGMQTYFEDREIGPMDAPGLYAEREPAPARWRSWCSVLPRRVLDDPFVDAARVLVAADLMPYLAAMAPHPDIRDRCFAATMSLSASFVPSPSRTEHVYCDAEAASLEHGILTGRMMARAEDGSLVAYALQQSLLRVLD